jgi:hypothetical protein
MAIGGPKESPIRGLWSARNPLVNVRCCDSLPSDPPRHSNPIPAASIAHGAFQSRAKISSVPASIAVTSELLGAAANQPQPAIRIPLEFVSRSTFRSRIRIRR